MTSAGEEFAWVLGSVALRATVLCLGVSLVLRLFRVRNSAFQHAARVAVVVVLLLLPFAPQPSWQLGNVVQWFSAQGHRTNVLERLSAEDKTDPRVVRDERERSARTKSGRPSHTVAQDHIDGPGMPVFHSWIALIYGCGVAGVLLHTGIAWLRALRTASRAVPIPEIPGTWESRDLRVPVTVGVLRSRILLPAGWRGWDNETIERVLAHEKAHVRRHDLLTLFLARLCLALYWYLPVVWVFVYALRDLAERSCDEAVILGGSHPIAYARILLRIAGSPMNGAGRVGLGLATTGSKSLEGRVLHILEFRPFAERQRKVVAFVILALLAGASSAAAWVQPVAGGVPLLALLAYQTEYEGTLHSKLAVQPAGGQLRALQPATEKQRLALPFPVQEADYVGLTDIPIPGQRRLQLAIVEGTRGVSQLFADLDFDGSFASSERHELSLDEVDPTVRGTILLYLPLGSAGPGYPLRIALPAGSLGPREDRFILTSTFVFATGNVHVQGRDVAVWVQYDPRARNAWPNYGWQGVDADGDGRIDFRANSAEFTFANDEQVIFQVGRSGLSIVSVDFTKGIFRVREHPIAANPRLTIRGGEPLGDFEFVDIEGNARRLRDFRGNHVLIDFWGTWCAPCVAELANIERAQREFGRRGLVVIGIAKENEEDELRFREFLRENHVSSIQAHPESAARLLSKTFRINAYPTKVLLDKDGTVLQLPGQELRGEALFRTLDELLPRE